MGGDAIYAALKEHLGVEGQDAVSDDGKVSLEHIECNAACDFAPVVMVNWEFFDNQTPQSARALVDDLRAGKPVKPTRGANSVVTPVGGQNRSQLHEFCSLARRRPSSVAGPAAAPSSARPS